MTTLQKSKLLRYWELLAPYKGMIALIAFLAVFHTGVSLFQPYFFHYIIDDIALAHGDLNDRLHRLLEAGAVMTGLIALSFLASYLNDYFSTVLNHKITAGLRNRLLRHMLHLPLRELTKMKTGGAASRLNHDSSAASQVVTRSIITPAVSLIQFSISLTMVFALNWRMSVGALTVIVPMGIATYLYSKRLRPIFREIGVTNSELSARSTEMFSGIRVARVYNREEAERRAYLKIYHPMIRKMLSARKRQAVINTCWNLAFGLIQIIVVILGVYLIIHQRATVGDILAIIMYANRIMSPIEVIVRSYGQLQEDLAAVDRLFEILDLPRDNLDRPNAVHAPTRVTSLVLDNVGFNYGTGGRKALDAIDLQVRGGETIALVGKSGAGKSTLTDLICRFYDPQEGAFYLNGRDIREIALKEYRRLLGIVQQDIFLFDGSVRDNIAYANPRATPQQIVAAARRANAAEFIETLPHGYDTEIGERGVKLSGGQRQRISIARAFLVDPEILIMDEATSHLDSESEQNIQNALRELLKDRTTFIIAHRLSTVTHADRIVVLGEGRICEVGTPEELIAQRGKYFDMLERQRSPLQMALS